MDYLFIRQASRLFTHPFTLVNIEAVDHPLVLVNAQFCELVGYSESEILGRNCRFLQGDATERREVEKIHAAIEQRLAVYSDLVNYKKEGELFINRLILLPLKLGGVQHYIGLQIDATQLVRNQPTSREWDTLTRNQQSEKIRDWMNTPLMKIRMILENNLLDQTSAAAILSSTLVEIREKIIQLPYGDNLPRQT